MGASPVPVEDSCEPPGHALTRQVKGVTVVEFHGAIDIAAASQVAANLHAVTAVPGARVVVDLRPAAFLDCTALGVLCTARHQALQGGGHLGVVCLRLWHLRILRATGLHHVLQPVTTLQQALDHALRHRSPDGTTELL